LQNPAGFAAAPAVFRPADDRKTAFLKAALSKLEVLKEPLYY
jgi:hypothetical protein